MPLNKRSFCVSGSIFGNFHCTWIMPNFSSLEAAVGEETTSECFQLQTYSPRWYLSIYPGGKTEASKGRVSCFVNLYFTCRSEICVKIHSFTLRNVVGKTLWSQNEYDAFDNTSIKGFVTSRKRNALVEELIDDVLIFCANVSYCSTCIKDSENTKYLGEMTPIAKMVEDHESFASNEENKDSVIFVGGKKLAVNSAIMSARSKIFEPMFEDDAEVKWCNGVHISDFDEEIIIAMIRFVHTGNVNVMDVNIALELLRAAGKYSMSDLMIYCNNYLVANLNEENVIQVLIKADACNAPDLKTKAMNYFRGGRGLEIIQRHRQLLKAHPDVLLDIIEADRSGDN